MMVNPEEFNKLVQYYKGEISDSALLNKSGRVAAETHLLLQDKTVPDVIVNARVKELRRERQRLTKRLREVSGVTSVAGGQPPPDDNEDGMLASGTLDSLLKQIIKNTAKSPNQAVALPSKSIKLEKATPDPSSIKEEKATRFNSVLEELKESGGKPKKKKTPTQTPLISREKTPREELLESVRKSAERLAKAREDIERIREKRKEIKRKTEAERLNLYPVGRIGQQAENRESDWNITRTRTGKCQPLNRKRRQRGKGLDIQKLLGKTGTEFHLPGYQNLGPGRHLAKRLARGDPGINRLDKIAKQHDIDYSHAKNLKDKWKADEKMIKAITKLPGKLTMTEKIVKKIIQAKRKLKM